MVVTRHQHNVTTIMLLPNCSASWAETRLFLFLICGTTIAVGVLWAIAGAWMVLPFSGIEAALVSYLIYRVCQRTHHRQVVTCCGDTVVVEIGARFPRRRWLFSRADTRLAVTEPEHPADTTDLCIYDQNNRVELGHFLTSEDKQLALDQLRREGLHIRVYHKSIEVI